MTLEKLQDIVTRSTKALCHEESLRQISKLNRELSKCLEVQQNNCMLVMSNLAQVVDLAINDDVTCKTEFAREYVGCTGLASDDSVHEKLVPVLPRVLRCLSLPTEHYKTGYFTRNVRMQLAASAAVVGSARQFASL